MSAYELLGRLSKEHQLFLFLIELALSEGLGGCCRLGDANGVAQSFACGRELLLCSETLSLI